MSSAVPHLHKVGPLWNPLFASVLWVLTVPVWSRLRHFQLFQGAWWPGASTPAGSMLKASFKGHSLSRFFHSSILISSEGMLRGGAVCKKLYIDFRRWFAASDLYSMWLESCLAFCFSLLFATSRRMSGGAILASRYRQLVLVDFRHPVIMRQLSLEQGLGDEHVLTVTILGKHTQLQSSRE